MARCGDAALYVRVPHHGLVLVLRGAAAEPGLEAFEGHGGRFPTLSSSSIPASLDRDAACFCGRGVLFAGGPLPVQQAWETACYGSAKDADGVNKA